MLLMLIQNYIFAICGMMMFQETDPVHFNSVFLALNTIWAVETLNW